MGDKIGVLALQGDVSEHIGAFRNAAGGNGTSSFEVIPVRTRSDLLTVDALAIPGGESTTISRLIEKNGLFRPLQEFEGGIFATCAGMVVIAEVVDDPRVRPLGLMDISVRRNVFGRQKDSFEADIGIPGLGAPFHAIFIRAPVADHAGQDVTVLGLIEQGMVALEKDRCMALSFHPELGKDLRLHMRFLQKCGFI